jgi:predicted RNA-binding Zn ribbon-like protein
MSDTVTYMGADVRFGPARWGRLAVALVNTAPYERQEDLLTSPGQLRELLLAHDEPGPIEINDRDLADARQARNALAAVFSARENGGQVAALLNDLLARTAKPRLAEHEGVPLHLHVEPPGASWGGWLTASGAMALALLIAEHGTGVLGGCQAHGCAHVLLRTGPGPARRFCDNACASRTRVAAYRANRTASTVQKTSNTGQKQTEALGSRQWRSAGDYPCVRILRNRVSLLAGVSLIR